MDKAQLQQLSGPQLAEVLALVDPPTAQAALCQELEAQVPQFILRVESVDASGAPVEAQVEVDDRPAAATPFEALVGVCVRRVRVFREGEERVVALREPAQQRKLVRVDWGGAVKAFSLSAGGDFTFFAPPTAFVPANFAPASAVSALTLRFDAWHPLFHGTVALTATPLYYPLTRAFLPALALLPAVDLFAGLNWRPGNDTVRLLVSGQLGLWALAHPTARATLGLTLWKHLVVLVSGDVRLLFPFLLLPGVLPEGHSPVSGGLAFSVGVGW